MVKKAASPSSKQARPILRVIDANVNRLREALRVMEEYYRFILVDKTGAGRCKRLRHGLEKIEQEIGRTALLACRDTRRDPFAGPEHRERARHRGGKALFVANCKRSQEAARTIEEYGKVLGTNPDACRRAKQIRFTLYALEKQSIRNNDL
ncbi:MAG: hypothetical protein PHC61_08140 [Chitinivibrionales bacterium]|nr:hypothetical protein [Chitinivibrionales bacterium]